MFTGIIEELGEVAEVEALTGSARLGVLASPELVETAKTGDSYAVNGVCLTLTDWEPVGSRVRLRFAVMAETLHRSSLGALDAGDPVNLERPLRLSARLGGHLVQGHVDAVGTIAGREPSEHWELVRVSLPGDIARYVVEKGSITVDGVSLTVVGVTDDEFTVSLIPETLARTTLGARSVGASVNLEVDVLAKYTERLLAARTVTA